MQLNPKFEIYSWDKTNKFLITPNVIFYSLPLIGLISSFIPGIQPPDTFPVIIFTSWFFLSFYFMIIQSRSYKKINRTHCGFMEFHFDKIIYNSKEIKISEIEEIEFTGYDIEGTKEFYFKGNFNPLLSNGTENTIEITLRNKTTISFYLKLKNQKDIPQIQEELISYMKAGVISPKKTMGLLGIGSYAAIQEFKKKYSVEYR